MPRPRIWTDGQLGEAVAAAQSWRDVARTLGLSPCPLTVKRLRGHAARLALDDTHLRAFTPAAPVASPEPLDKAGVVEAVSSSRLWLEALDKLHLPRTAASYRRLQRLAGEAGISLSGAALEQDIPVELPAALRGGVTPTTLEKGARSEGAILAALLRLGYNVLLPFGVARYDLVIETTAGFKRVQCKTGRVIGDSIVISTVSKGKSYDGDADYFGIHEPVSGNVYLLPFNVVGNRRALYLRINGNKPHGRSAKRYQIA